MRKEIRQFFRLYKEVALLSRVTLVSTHWDMVGDKDTRPTKQSECDDLLKQDNLRSFIDGGARTDKLEPKPSDEPFERNPISPEDARKVLVDAILSIGKADT
jgi:hypothetical protein